MNNIIQKILSPLSSDAPAGAFLQYTPLYDQIQEARRQEDENLPQGVWESSYKKADWGLVESLCLEALTTTTKDLQITAWLVEAWFFLKGSEGLLRGISLLHDLSETFWTTLYPSLEGGDSRRIKIYEWLDDQMTQHLLTISIAKSGAQEGKNFSYGEWLTLNHYEAFLKKTSGESLKAAEDWEGLKAALRQTEDSFFHQQAESMVEVLNVLKKLKDFLEIKIKRVLFSHLEQQLENLKRLYREKFYQVIDETPSSSLTTQEVSLKIKPLSSSRDEAFCLLENIAEFLTHSDPHSPIPAILKKIISWKDQSFMEIFEEFKGDAQLFQAFLVFLKK